MSPFQTGTKHVLLRVCCRAATDLVLPLELSPHTPELHIWAAGRADVVHDVNVDVIQNHHTAVSIGCGLIHNVAEDGPSLC